MEHHGPSPWMLHIPGLPHEAGWETFNGAVVLLTGIVAVSILGRLAIVGKVANHVVPSPKPSLVGSIDLLVEGLHNMVVSTLGPHGEKHFPFIASLFIFVLFSNLMGLLPVSASPSASLNTTLALGLASFLYYNYMGIKEHGIVGYGKHFLMGMGIFGVPIAFFEILSHVLRPATLGLRLFLNMSIDHLLAGSFASLCKWVLPVPLLLFGIVVCTIQAFLFATLTSVYLQMATEHEEGGDHSHGHH